MKYSKALEASAMARRLISDNGNNPFAAAVDEYIAGPLTMYPKNFQAMVRSEVAKARKFKSQLGKNV